MSIGTMAKIRKCQDIDLSGTQLYIETIGHSRFRITKLFHHQLHFLMTMIHYHQKAFKRLQIFMKNWKS